MNNINQDKHVKIGEIWRTKDVPLSPMGRSLPKIQNPVYVAILLDDENAYDAEYPEIRVAPVSTEIEYASDMDLILSHGQNPLKTTVMIELWNNQPMLKMNLDKCCGSLSGQPLKHLLLLHQKFWGIEVDTEGINTGKPIVNDEDERLAFQEREIEKTLYLRGPVNDLMEKWEREEQQSLAKDMLKGIVSIGYNIYTTLTRPIAGLETAGVAAAPEDRRQIYENEAFRGEIYKEGNILFLELTAKVKDLIGKYVAISIISAKKVNYKSHMLIWEQNGPETITSENSIDSSGRIKIKLAETKFDLHNEDDYQLFRRIFEEIELNMFDDKQA